MEAFFGHNQEEDGGVIILAATKKMDTEDPALVEASAMLWTLQLVECPHFQCCIIEGDAKNYIYAYIGKLDDCSWALSAICYDVKFLLHCFTSIDFVWVRREANMTVHPLVKFAS